MLLVGTESHIITHKKYTCLVMCVSSILTSSSIVESPGHQVYKHHHHKFLRQHGHHQAYNIIIIIIIGAEISQRERERERGEKGELG